VEAVREVLARASTVRLKPDPTYWVNRDPTPYHGLVIRAGLHSILPALLLAACVAAPPAPAHLSLGNDLAPLREAFNAKAGTTRVVIIIAPT
jgi:hypothetical protein